MAEKEYIEREAIINKINELLSEYEDCDGIFLPKHLIPSGLCKALIFIKTQPTADVQEVVRCGLCKHYKLRGGSKWCVLHMVRMHSDDFCSYGAKMDKE